MRSSIRFGRDENAAVGWTIVQIAILLLIPIALFIFWLQYLRRINKDENAKYGPWGAPKKDGVATASTGDQKRQCPKCGLWVRPPRGSGPPTCPNCMSIL